MSKDSPDWGYWGQREDVKVFEALVLIEGRTPGKQPPEEAETSDTYKRRLRALTRAMKNRGDQFSATSVNAASPALSPVKLLEVAAWALSKRIPLPEEFPRKTAQRKPALLMGRSEPVLVRMTAPYYGLGNLVEAIALSISSADSNAGPSATNKPQVTTDAWAQKLKDLAQSGALKGHSFDDLRPPRDWVSLDMERDCFFVEELNACAELRSEGLRFEVVRDGRADMEFVAFLEERALNDDAINWTYWVEQMPELSAGEAARLMSGMDPDLHPELSARPTRSDTRAASVNALQLERLALRQGRERDKPTGWLEWAREGGRRIHPGFELAVVDLAEKQAANPPATRASQRRAEAAEAEEDWKTLAKAKAVEIIRRQRASDLYPSQKNIADEIAREFRRDKVFGADGKPLSGAYIKRHALKGVSSAQAKQLSTSISGSK